MQSEKELEEEPFPACQGTIKFSTDVDAVNAQDNIPEGICRRVVI